MPIVFNMQSIYDTFDYSIQNNKMNDHLCKENEASERERRQVKDKYITTITRKH